MKRLKDQEPDKVEVQLPTSAGSACDYTGRTEGDTGDTSAPQQFKPLDYIEPSKSKGEIGNLCLTDTSEIIEHIQLHCDGHTTENISFMPLSEAAKEHPMNHSGAQPIVRQESVENSSLGKTKLTCLYSYCDFELSGVESIR